jgi:hypothetical protein
MDRRQECSIVGFPMSHQANFLREAFESYAIRLPYLTFAGH